MTVIFPMNVNLTGALFFRFFGQSGGFFKLMLYYVCSFKEKKIFMSLGKVH